MKLYSRTVGYLFLEQNLVIRLFSALRINAKAPIKASVTKYSLPHYKVTRGRKYFSPQEEIFPPLMLFLAPPLRKYIPPQKNKVSTLMLIATFTSIKCRLNI